MIVRSHSWPLLHSTVVPVLAPPPPLPRESCSIEAGRRALIPTGLCLALRRMPAAERRWLLAYPNLMTRKLHLKSREAHAPPPAPSSNASEGGGRGGGDPPDRKVLVMTRAVVRAHTHQAPNEPRETESWYSPPLSDAGTAEEKHKQDTHRTSNTKTYTA